MRFVVTFLVFLIVVCGHPCRPLLSAADPPDGRPQWIWSSGDRMAAGEVTFSASLDLADEFTRVDLWIATDFAQSTLRLNGGLVAELSAYDPPREIEITPHVRRGKNTLQLQAVGVDGPSAVALKLIVTRIMGEPLTLLSNASWSTDNGRSVTSLGEVARVPWLISASSTEIQPFDDYTQWKRALGETGPQSPRYEVQPGFELQQLRFAQPEEGSWVSLAFVPDGRLIVAKEDRGLLRLTLDAASGHVEQVELVNDELQECRGLLFALGALYVNANESKGLYRLRDTSGDGSYDETTLLHHSTGGTGHGRNDLALGPDGMIYSIHGDSVDLPKDFADHTSPYREHRRGARSREGHVIRTDPDGDTWELVVAGLRNPYGIAFHRDGEMFTYDADAEFDMGSPWYRPTRVNHLVTGGDFGWRGVTGDWPPYFHDHPDNARPNLDIGKGSPTAVQFGYGSNFPAEFRRALYVLDWAYGRILSVHMTPRGASYFCRAKPFVRGLPLNVTDLTFGPDGAMYFVTGGRKTQSGLYRVRFMGNVDDVQLDTSQTRARDKHARRARSLRRELESLQRSVGRAAVDRAWPQLDHADPWIRYAARCALEHQPIEIWQERALQESSVTAALTGLLALARSGDTALRPRIVGRLVSQRWDRMDVEQVQLALQACILCNARSLETALQQELGARLEPLYPHRSNLVNRRLSQLLVELQIASVVPRTMTRLAGPQEQADQLHCLYVIRDAQQGWTPPLRRRYFAALNQTDGYLGGQGMPGFLANIRKDAVASLSEQEREACETLLAGGADLDAPGSPPRPVVKQWQLEELSKALAKTGHSADFERGRQMYEAALCARCHRLGRVGRSIGPDLTAVSRRFSRQNLLESILVPSRVIADDYRSQRIVTSDGRVLEGRVVYRGDFRAPTLMIATNPLAPAEVTELAKSEIESHSPSSVSFMPQGLLDTLSQDEILDLFAYIQAGGDAEHPSYR